MTYLLLIAIGIAAVYGGTRTMGTDVRRRRGTSRRGGVRWPIARAGIRGDRP